MLICNVTYRATKLVYAGYLGCRIAAIVILVVGVIPGDSAASTGVMFDFKAL